MKFGLRYCNIGRYTDPVQAIELLQAGEEAGFESAWTVEHTVVPAGYQSTYPYSPNGRMGARDDLAIPDPLIWLSYVAAATTRIRLATGILLLPQHNPVIAAKQVATLDCLSGGRMLLGIGVGWLKEEFDTIGVPFAERGARTDEYIAVMRALWSMEMPSFHGAYFNFDRAYCLPQPPNGSVPIIVGGHSKARRPARRKARRRILSGPRSSTRPDCAGTAIGAGKRARPRRNRDYRKRSGRSWGPSPAGRPRRIAGARASDADAGDGQDHRLPRRRPRLEIAHRTTRPTCDTWGPQRSPSPCGKAPPPRPPGPVESSRYGVVLDLLHAELDAAALIDVEHHHIDHLPFLEVVADRLHPLLGDLRDV